MTILVVHEVSYLTKVVFEYHNFSEMLASRGHRVLVVEFNDLWKRSSRTDWGHLRTRVVHNVSRTGGSGSVTVYQPGFLKVNALSRLIFVWTSFIVLRKLFRTEHVDCVLLYAVPTFGWLTILLAHARRVPVFFRSIDILHHLAAYPILRIPTKILERFVYRHADKILALTPMLGRYTVRLGAHPDRIEDLYPGIDLKLFRPSPPDRSLQNQWGITPQHLVVLFLGTLFDFTGLDEVISRFPTILRHHPNTRLLIVGGGPQHEKLRTIVENLRLRKSVIFTGFQPYLDMPRYINLASLCINPFRIIPTTRDIIPSKLLQYLACGKPLLATPLPGTLDLLAGEEQGVVYANLGEPFQASFLNLLGNRRRREELGQRATEYIRVNHNWEDVVDRLEYLLRETI